MKTVERLSYFPFFPADYMLDTNDLTLVEHGAYLTLMFRYYWQGVLPDAEKYRFCRSDAERAATDTVLQRFFHIDGGTWRHNRIERELEKLVRFVEHQSKAGRASGEARARAAASNPLAPEAPDASNVLAPTPPAKPRRINGAQITFDGVSFAGITEEIALRWQDAYPAIPIPDAISQAAAWLAANPMNRKSNNERFLVNWFKREQDKAGRVR